jgi:hypothetical protein
MSKKIFSKNKFEINFRKNILKLPPKADQPLAEKLNKESELVTNCHQLKMVAEGGKIYGTEFYNV